MRMEHTRLIGRGAAVALALIAIAPSPASAAPPSFQGLGSLSGVGPSVAYGVSADGSTVVGAGSTAFRWTRSGGMQSRRLVRRRLHRRLHSVPLDQCRRL